MAGLALLKRQSGIDTNPDDEYYDGFWWSPKGMAIRYAIVGTLFATIFLYLVLGYIHAHRRVRAGQPPLAYHRWMVRRYNSYPPQNHWNAGYQNPYHYNIGPNGQGYAMDGYAPPPPAYNHGDAPPPVYQPPQGGSKVAADQAYGRPPMERMGESSHGPANAAPQRE